MCRVCLTQIPLLMSANGLRLTQIPLLIAANGLNLTQIPQISRFCFWWWEISRRLVDSHGACPSAPISKAHTDFKDNLWKFVIICGWKGVFLEQYGELPWDLTPGVQIREICGICVSQRKATPTQSVRFNARRAKPWDLWDLCELCEPKKSKKKSVWAQQFGIEK